MIHSTQPIDDATPLDDISGLILPSDKVYTLKENLQRDAYIKALKDADSGDYSSLIAMHRETY